jgi:hypothetical protein
LDVEVGEKDDQWCQVCCDPPLEEKKILSTLSLSFIFERYNVLICWVSPTI